MLFVLVMSHEKAACLFIIFMIWNADKNVAIQEQNMDTTGLEKVFNSKKQNIQNFIERWEVISQELAQCFGQERTSIQHQLNALNAASRKAYQNLIKKIG